MRDILKDLLAFGIILLASVGAMALTNNIFVGTLIIILILVAIYSVKEGGQQTMKCRDCKYCAYYGLGIAGGYKCEHPKIMDSAKKYEKEKGKRINKSHNHIGYGMIKTSLRYCPYKMKEDSKQ